MADDWGPGGKWANATIVDPSRFAIAAPAPAEAPKKGGLGDDLQRGYGQAVSSVGSAIRDWGPTEGIGRSMSDYGDAIVAANPSEITSFDDIRHKPGTAVREAIGENVPQIGAIVAAGAAGRLAGAGIGAALAGTATAPAGGVGAIPGVVVGEEIGGRVGGAIPTYLQEYGSIRAQQRRLGTDNKLTAALGGAGATALEFLFGPEAAAAAAVARTAKRAGFSLLKTGARQALGEGVTEVAQTAIERAAAGQELTGQEAADDYAVSGFKGMAAGGAMGTAIEAVRPGRPAVNPDPTAMTDLLAQPQADPNFQPREYASALSGGQEAFDTQRYNMDLPAGAQQTLLPPDITAPSSDASTFFRGADRDHPVEILGDVHLSDDGQEQVLIRALDNGRVGPVPVIDLVGDVPARPAATVDASRQLPIDPEQDSLFPNPDAVEHSPAKVTLRLRAANPDAEGYPGKADSYLLKLSKTVSDGLASGDMAGVQAAIQDQASALETASITPETIAKRQAMLQAAAALVGEYRQRTIATAVDQAASRDPAAQALLAQRPTEAPAAPEDAPSAMSGDFGQARPAEDTSSTEQIMRERNAQEAEREAQAAAMETASAHVDQSFQRENDKFRQQQEENRASTLTRVIDDPTTRNVTGRFISALRAQGHSDLSIRPQEAETIMRYEAAKEAFTQPDVVPAAPDESDNFGIPEKGVPKAAKVREPAPVPTPEPVAEVVAPAAIPAAVEPPPAVEAPTAPITPRKKLSLPKDKTAAPAKVEDDGGPKVAGPTPEQMTEKLVKLHDNGLIDQTQLNQMNTLVQQGNLAMTDISEMANAAVRENDTPAKDTSAKDVAPVLKAINDAHKMKLIDARTRQGLIVASKTMDAEQLTSAMQNAIIATKLPESMGPTRRQFLAGVGAAAAVSAMPRPAKATIAPGLQKAIASGNADNAVRWIAENSTNPLYRRIASIVAKGSTGGASIRITSPDEGSATLQDREDLEGARGSTDTVDPKTGKAAILIARRPNDPTDGVREQTVLHEALHAYIAARYRTLSTYSDDNKAIVGFGKEQAADTDVLLWVARWRLLSDTLTEKYADLVETKVWAQEIARSPDEAMTWVLTDADAQAFLKSIDWQGNPIPVKAPPGNSWFDRFVRWLAKTLNIHGAKDVSAFAEMLTAGETLLTVAQGDNPDYSYAIALEKKARETGQYERSTLAEASTIQASRIGQAVISAKLNTTGVYAETTKKLMTLYQIAQRWGAQLPALKTWYDSLMLASGRVEHMLEADDKISVAWRSLKNQAERKQIGEMLFAATRQGIDPRQPMSAVNGGAKPTEYAELSAKHAALSAPAKAVFNDVLNTFSNKLSLKKAAAIQAIKTGGASSASQEASMRMINEVFRTVNRVYFPMSRFGRFMVVGRKPEYDAAEAAHREAVAAQRLLDDTATPEERTAANALVASTRVTMDEAKADGYAVVFRESYAKQKFAADDLKADGYDTHLMLRDDYIRQMDGADPEFVSKLASAMDASDGDADTKKALLTLLREAYLTTLPEHSALKRGIGRKNIEGYDEDAERTFASACIRDGHLIARLEYAATTRASLAEMNSQAKDRTTGNQELQQVVAIAKQHHAAMLTYDETPVQDAIANTGYLWFLGASPAFGLINMLQTHIVAMPMIAAHHGLASTVTGLTKAMTHIAGLQVSSWGADGWQGEVPFDKITSDPAERTMLYDLQGRGVIDRTMAQDMGTTANGTDPKWKTMMKVASWLPHYTEKVNRIATALTAYRLQVADNAKTGKTVDPTAFAEKMVQDSHFNYSRENAPLLWKTMKWGKVILQFKKYQQAMAYAFIENTRLALPEAFGTSPDATAEQRAVARRTLFGLMTTHMLMAGSLGLPGATTIAFALDLLMKQFTDDDDPWDSKTEWRKFLADHLGVKGGQIAAKGLPTLLGVDLSQRVGVGNIFNPLHTSGVDVQGRAKFAQYAAAALGPAGSIVGDMFEASLQFHNGNTAKAWELMLPKVVRDVMKSSRFSAEGITTHGGNTLVAAENIPAIDKVLQAIGFMPAALSEHYDQQSSELDRATAVGDARKALLKQFALARIANDPVAEAEARKAVAAFNARRAVDNDGKPITPKSLYAAAKARANYSKQVIRGVHLSKGTEGVADEGDYAASYPDPEE